MCCQAALAQAQLGEAQTSAGWAFPPGANDVAVPAHLTSTGEIIVRMTVEGRGYDLLLDTGMGEDELDGSVFHALGLDKAASPVAQVASAQFGALTFHQLPFKESSFFRRDEAGDLIVGLLGYDFFAPAVVEIDYDHEEIHIINPSAFSPPAGGERFSLIASDTVPFVGASIGAATSGWFIVDTGAATVTVFPRLVAQYPEVFASNKRLGSDEAHSYYHEFWPMCGHLEMQPYSVSQVKLDTLGVKDWVAWEVPSDSCFSLRHVDGLLGYDFLRLFDLYVDYPDSFIYFVPNEIYDDAPNTLK